MLSDGCGNAQGVHGRPGSLLSGALDLGKNVTKMCVEGPTSRFPVSCCRFYGMIHFIRIRLFVSDFLGILSWFASIFVYSVSRIISAFSKIDSSAPLDSRNLLFGILILFNDFLSRFQEKIQNRIFRRFSHKVLARPVELRGTIQGSPIVSMTIHCGPLKTVRIPNIMQ